MEQVLLIPGPTPLPPRVRQAMATPMINHRGSQFAAIYQEVQARLRQILRLPPEQPAVIFPSAGTGAMEAAVVNVFSPGDRVLACVMGVFGARFAQIAATYGLEVDRLEVESGRVVTPEAVEERLNLAAGAGKPYAGVLVTHNETSTGVLLDLENVARVVRQSGAGALLLADAISSLGAVPVFPEEWGVDVLLTGSQKALMCPPGLGILILGERAWQAAEKARLPRFYWDVRPYRDGFAKGQTPYTPAVSLWYALRESTGLLLADGLPSYWQRHRAMAAMARTGLAALGFSLLADDAWASPTVTAARPPEGVEATKLIAWARDEQRVVFAGGQGSLTGKIIRLAHMGYIQPEDVLTGLGALGKALRAEGRPVKPGQATDAALAAFAALRHGA